MDAVRTPWQSIRLGVVEPSTASSPLSDALDSPCTSCATSPCCTHLPVHGFTVSTLSDLSYVAYLLNFDRIRVGLSRTGGWSAYYVQPCRYLDRDSFLCTVHEQPEQPQICRRYNPYSCWYRAALTTSVGEEFLLIDRSRLAALERLVEFDEHRNIVSMPTWEALMARFQSLSDGPVTSPEPPLPDPAFDDWVQVSIGRKPPPAVPVETFSYAENQSPCDGCSAPCCDTLSFPQGLPTTRSSLDFMRFALGFPGVEITATDEGWWLTIKTQCRHLVDGRCAIYGRPERPLTCRYYDEWSCSYKYEFGTPVPPTVLRARLEHFLPLVEGLRFDANGAVVHIPPVAELRENVESTMRTRSHA